MGVTDRYRSAEDLPQLLPVFPLRGAILLPRSSLMVNVFEPRYLALLDDALATDRLIGIVQPTAEAAADGEPALSPEEEARHEEARRFARLRAPA